MDPSAAISTAKTAMGAGSILLRIGKWVQRVRNGSARFTHPSNRDCITEFPIRINGTHTKLRHGSYWLLVASDSGYAPLQRLSMLPDGKWSTKIEYLEHKSGNPVVIALAWSSSLVDTLLVTLIERRSGQNDKPVILPDQRCLRVDEELVLQIEAQNATEDARLSIANRQPLAGVDLTAQEQEFLDTRYTNTEKDLNKELLGILCEYPDAGNFVAELRKLADRLTSLDLEESQVEHIIRGGVDHLVGNIIILRRIASHLLWRAKFRQEIHRSLLIPLLLYCSKVGHGPPQFYSAFSAARRVDSFTGEYVEVPETAIKLIQRVLDSDEPLSSPLSFADLDRIIEICPPFGEAELQAFRELISAVDPTLKEIVMRLDEFCNTRQKNQDSNDS